MCIVPAASLILWAKPHGMSAPLHYLLECLLKKHFHIASLKPTISHKIYLVHIMGSENGFTTEKLWNDTSPIAVDELDGWYHDDALWMVTCSCIIFNMQTGFGMLESGCVSLKNEVNIMMKNMVDVVLGGVTYWAFGYGMSYGESTMSNWLIGFGDWFVNSEGVMIGPTFTGFIFQMSFATTATTIVSGAIAERFDFNAYCIFSLVRMSE